MEAYIPDSDSRKQAVVEFFAKSGQQFLPIMELLIDAKQQLHDFAHGVGVAAIEGLLELSASKLAGMPHPGKAARACGLCARHGAPPRPSEGRGGHGQEQVPRAAPRLRTLPDAAGRTLEVEPPAYAAAQARSQAGRPRDGRGFGWRGLDTEVQEDAGPDRRCRGDQQVPSEPGTQESHDHGLGAGTDAGDPGSRDPGGVHRRLRGGVHPCHRSHRREEGRHENGAGRARGR